MTLFTLAIIKVMTDTRRWSGYIHYTWWHRPRFLDPCPNISRPNSYVCCIQKPIWVYHVSLYYNVNIFPHLTELLVVMILWSSTLFSHSPSHRAWGRRARSQFRFANAANTWRFSYKKTMWLFSEGPILVSLAVQLTSVDDEAGDLDGV